MVHVWTELILLRFERGSSRRSGCRQRVHGSSDSGSMSDQHLIDDTRGWSKEKIFMRADLNHKIFIRITWTVLVYRVD